MTLAQQGDLAGGLYLANTIPDDEIKSFALSDIEEYLLTNDQVDANYSGLKLFACLMVAQFIFLLLKRELNHGYESNCDDKNTTHI